MHEVVPQNEGPPGESCDHHLAKLAAARTLVPARLPLLRISSFQSGRNPCTGLGLLDFCSSTGSLHILLATLLLVRNSKRRMSFCTRNNSLHGNHRPGFRGTG
jgi:hypothetical protein